MRRITLFAVAASFVIAAAPAAATNAADAQCLVALGQLGGVEDAKAQAATISAVHYYLGRIDGRAPGADLAKLLKDAAGAMKPDEVRATLDRCGAEMKRREQALQRAGQSLAAGQPPAR